MAQSGVGGVHRLLREASPGGSRGKNWPWRKRSSHLDICEQLEMAALLFSIGNGNAFSAGFAVVLYRVHLYTWLDGAGSVAEQPSEEAAAAKQNESPA